MLVIHRKKGESILINDDIEVRLCEIVHSNKVKIGIKASADVKVMRDELVEKGESDE